LSSVVVLGSGQGGLSAAAHLSHRGYAVTVIDQHVFGGKAGQIGIEGYRLDPGPSIIIMKEIYDESIRSLGFNPDEFLEWKRLDPITRVHFQGRMIDIPSDLEGALDLVSSFSEHDRSSLKRLIDTLSPLEDLINASVFSKPFEKPVDMLNPSLLKFGMKFNPLRNYKQLVDQMFQTKLLRAFFYGFPSYSGQSYSSKVPGAFFIPYHMLTSGVWYPSGGIGAIPETFKEISSRLGATFIKAKFLDFVFEGNRIKGVNTDQGEIQCDAVVSNIDRLTIEKQLGRVTPDRPSYSYFTIHWGINRELDHVEHHTLLIPDEFELGFEDLYNRRVFPSKPIVYLNNPSKIDSASAPAGKTNLFAVITSPGKEEYIDWKEKTPIFQNLVRQEMSKAHIDFEEVDFERIQTPNYFESQHGSYLGSLYGADEPSRLFGMFPLSNRDPIFENLTYCGGSVQPGAGLPMVTLSGKFAANLIDSYFLKRSK
jgi:phytoene desaturase